MSLFSWGSSMYGGYYVNYFDESGKIRGEHFAKFKDLAGFVSGLGMSLQKSKRLDN